MDSTNSFLRKWAGRARRWSGGWRSELRQKSDQLSAALAREAAQAARAEALAAQLAAAQAEAAAAGHRLAGTATAVDELTRQLAAARAEAAAASAQLAAIKGPPRNSLPSILSVTLPKSGTVYLTALFGQGLGHHVAPISLTYFPKDLIDWNKLEEMQRGGMAVPSHLDASPFNLQYLTAYRQRIHLHLRDPRQATLSMTHHMARYQKQFGPLHGAPLQLCPTPPPTFHEWPLTEQIGWMIAHYLPSCVTWIGDWLAVLDATGGPPFPILQTTFEEMIRDEAAVLGRILAFFGIPAERFARPTVAKTMDYHFRQGKPDEWRGVYTPAQQAEATRQVPPEWVVRFGWDHAGPSAGD